MTIFDEGTFKEDMPKQMQTGIQDTAKMFTLQKEPSVYVSKLHLTFRVDGTIRMAMTDFDPLTNIEVVRSSTTLSLHNFISFAETMHTCAEQIKIKMKDVQSIPQEPEPQQGDSA